MWNKKNISTAGKELAELGLPARFLLAPMVVENRGKRTAPTRSVEKTMEHQLAAWKRYFLGLSRRQHGGFQEKQ